MSNLIYFGSAFNPPHRGHMQAIKWLSQYGHVLAGPSASHAFGKKMLDFNTRVELLSQMIKFHEVNCEICEIEKELVLINAPVYTWTVLNTLKERNPDKDIIFAMGPDNNTNFEKFFNYQKILDTFQILIIPEINSARSTDIRNAIKENNLEFVKKETSTEIASTLMNLYRN